MLAAVEHAARRCPAMRRRWPPLRDAGGNGWRTARPRRSAATPLAAARLSTPRAGVPAASSCSLRVWIRPKRSAVAVVRGLDARCRRLRLAARSHVTMSGWTSGAAPISCSSRALRISLEDDWSSRQSVLWLAVARATARARASAGPGVPALTSSRLARRCSSRRTGSPRRRCPPAPVGGGAPASTTTTVAPR